MRVKLETQEAGVLEKYTQLIEVRTKWHWKSKETWPLFTERRVEKTENKSKESRLLKKWQAKGDGRKVDDLDSLCRNSADGWDQTHSYIRTIQPRYRSGTNLKIRKKPAENLNSKDSHNNSPTYGNRNIQCSKSGHNKSQGIDGSNSGQGRLIKISHNKHY